MYLSIKRGLKSSRASPLYRRFMFVEHVVNEEIIAAKRHRDTQWKEELKEELKEEEND